jgi:hypothetical protein
MVIVVVVDIREYPCRARRLYVGAYASSRIGRLRDLESADKLLDVKLRN